MIPYLQGQLRQAIEQSSAQLTGLVQDAEGDIKVAIQIANTWLSELEAEGSVTSGVEAQADALQDLSARASAAPAAPQSVGTTARGSTSRVVTRGWNSATHRPVSMSPPSTHSP